MWVKMETDLIYNGIVDFIEGEDVMKIGKKIWVTCPSCGNKKTKARYGELDFECKCGIAFTAYIANGIQTTVIHEGEGNAQEDDLSLTEQLDKYRRQRELLAL